MTTYQSNISKEFLDQLLDKTDLLELISARVNVIKRSKNYVACCPFHEEKTPSFNINPIKQFYYCFGCSAAGNAVNFLMEYDKLSFVEAVSELASKQGVDLPCKVGAGANFIANNNSNNFKKNSGNNSGHNSGDTNQPSFFQAQFALLEQACVYYQWLLRQQNEHSLAAVKYLQARGISGKLAQKFRLGYASVSWDGLLKRFANKNLQVKSANSQVYITQEFLIKAGLVVKSDSNKVYDRFRGRLMFPIRDRRGRVVGFGARTLDKDGMPKYLNSPETALFLKSKILYGLYELMQSARHVGGKYERICVVEGYMDVIGLAQHDINYAVATLGTATSEDHVRQLTRLTGRIIFCFDGDRAGKAAAVKALDVCLPLMSGAFEVKFLFLPEGEDPDSIVSKKGAGFFEDQLTSSVPLSEFLFSHLSNGLDLSFADGRAVLLDLLLPALVKVPAGSFRTLLISSAAKITQLSTGQLEQSLLVATPKLGSSVSSGSQNSELADFSFDSYVDRAIYLLIYSPKLVLSLDAKAQQGLNLISESRVVNSTADNSKPKLNDSVGVLLKLISWFKHELTGSKENISFAKIMEHFCDENVKKKLAKLALLDHPLSQSELAVEFCDLIRKFNKDYQLSIIDRLILKSQKDSLTLEEKDRLKDLLKQRKLELK